MTTPPGPTNPKHSGGIHIGDLSGDRDVNVTLTDVAGGDQIKITNSPGATVIKEAPRKLTREEQLAQRNRHTMLLKVKAYWVDGVLANSLHSKVIPLDRERNPGAVTRPRPWDMLWQVKDQQPQPLPPGTRIIDRFQYMAGEALLILGKPGSGKTTMLLELAGDLLSQATQDESLRIPVVFNLSSWASKRLPLTDWLMTELQILYLIPKKTAQTWIKDDDILPLLDGLDEVAQKHRAACIKAINAYREAQGTPLVVCSRIADYEAIGEKLLLSDALILRPLTLSQINEYLVAGGIALDGVRHAILQDSILQEMVQSPIYLSIMALAYRDHPLEQFAATNLNDRRRQLFATYIHRQLPKRKKDPNEDVATTIIQLTYLAHQITQRDQSIFLIERLQPDWLPTLKLQRTYQWSFMLSLGLIFGLGLGLDWGHGFGSVWGLLLGVAGGLIGGKVVALRSISPREKLSWSWKNITPKNTIWGLMWGMVSGFVFLLVLGLELEALGAILGLMWGMLVTWLLDKDLMFVSVLATGAYFELLFGLAGMLCGALYSGLVSGLVELKTTPNEGIKNSIWSAVRVGVVLGPVFGMVLGVVFTSCNLFFALYWGSFTHLFRTLDSALSLGWILGLSIGLLGGGGLAVIQHYNLRYWLHYHNFLPFSLTPFLDMATERLILQKVGGGYRFVHRLLQEYLASLYVEEDEGLQN